MEQKSFFSRRTFIIVATLSMASFVLIQLIIVASIRMDRQHSAKEESHRIAQLNSRPVDEKAVENAQKYLSANISRIDPATRLMLDYVQRRFNLDKALNKDAHPINVLHGGVSASEEIDYILRIAYPDKIERVEPKNISNTLMITNIYSANCDHLNPPKVFWSTLKDNVDRGGYPLTHNALAFAMLKDNNCSIPDDIEDIKPLVFSKIARIAGDQGTTADLRYEAAALLLLNGRHDLIEESWIDQIIKEQHPDGSWIAMPGDTTNQSHATLLAMWAILEYKNLNKPYEPIIRRPPKFEK